MNKGLNIQIKHWEKWSISFSDLQSMFNNFSFPFAKMVIVLFHTQRFQNHSPSYRERELRIKIIRLKLQMIEIFMAEAHEWDEDNTRFI